MSQIKNKLCYPSDLRFSFDLETTGLIHEMPDGKPFLLELALVPFSTSTGKIHKEKAFHVYHKVPSLEELKKTGKVSDFVLNDSNLVKVCKDAHSLGISLEEMALKIEAYLSNYRTAPEAPGNPKKAVILSKSIAGLDRPILTQSFGAHWVEKIFHHRMIDLSSCAAMISDANLGILETASASNIVKQILGIEDVPHTALEDAFLLGQVYLILLDKLKALK